jgi:hypothetical protein
MKERQFAEIVGVDISHRALESAESRLKLDRLATRQRDERGSPRCARRRLRGPQATAAPAARPGFQTLAVRRCLSLTSWRQPYEHLAVEPLEQAHPIRLPSFRAVAPFGSNEWGAAQSGPLPSRVSSSPS